MTETNAHKLQEMGFSEAQAQDALAATGNDLTKAISFLFGESLDAPPAGSSEAPYIVDSPAASVPLANPHDLPMYVGDYAMAPAADAFQAHGVATGIEHADADSASLEARVGEATDDSASSASGGSSRAASPAPRPENRKTDGHTAAVVWNGTRGLQPWVSLLAVLARYPPVARAVLESASTSPVAAEVQRIVYFVLNFDRSTRWYVATDGLAAQDVPRGTYGEDVVLGMLECLMRHVPELRPVLQSRVESPDDDVDKELTVLEIDAESRAGSLYETLNALFWQKNLDFLGKIKYAAVAPVVTLQLVCDDDSYCAPFDVPDVLYPELYSDVALPRIEREVRAARQAEKDYHAVSRSLMDLNFFEGKRVDSLLKSAGAALRDNAGARDDLQRLAAQLADSRRRQIARQTDLRAAASAGQLKSYDRVIADTPALRKYKLLGAVVSEQTYFVRCSDTWLEMDAGVAVDFAHVRDSVNRASQQGPHLVTLYYGDASEMGPVELREQVAPEEPAEEKNGVPETTGGGGGGADAGAAGKAFAAGNKDNSAGSKEAAAAARSLPDGRAPGAEQNSQIAAGPAPAAENAAKKARRGDLTLSVATKTSAISVPHRLVRQFMREDSALGPDLVLGQTSKTDIS